MLPDPPSPRNDPRPVDDLFNVALCEPDEDLAWDAVMALHWRGTREVLDRATALAASACALERRVGAEVLGQIGCPDRPFTGEASAILSRMLHVETDPAVLKAVLVSLSHQDGTTGRRDALKFREHPDPEVRYALVLALTTQTEPWAIAGLIELSRDRDPWIRDWSTFGLGSMIEVDTPEIRAALAARLHDDGGATGGEALLGLARRKDSAVLPILQKRLSGGDADDFDIEAACVLGDPELLPLLLALRPSDRGLLPWMLDDAIAACTRPGTAETPARP